MKDIENWLKKKNIDNDGLRIDENHRVSLYLSDVLSWYHRDVLKGYKKHKRWQQEWVSVKEGLPEGDLEAKANEITVIGFSEKWIHPDFNPLGQRVCHITEDGWGSSRWNASHDCYIDVQPEEGDNPTHWQPLPTKPQ